MLRGLYGQSAVYLIGRLVPSVIVLATTALFTRLMSPEEYSWLVLATATAQIGSSAAFQWLRLSILRYGVGEERDTALASIWALYKTVGITVAGCTLAFALASYLLGFDYLFVLICGTAVVCQAWFDFTQELQRNAMQPLRYSISFGVRTLLLLILGTAAILFTRNGYMLALAMCASTGLAPLFFIKGLFNWRGHPVDARINRRVLSYGLPLALSLVLATISVQVDRYVIAILLGASAAGLYGPVAELTRQTLASLIQSITLASYPLAIKALKNHGAAAAVRQMAENLALLMWVLTPTAATLVILREELTFILLGEQFRVMGASLLPLLGLAMFFMCLRMFYFSQANQLGERTGLQVWIALAGATSSVVLNFAFIPLMGLQGASLAAAISQAIALVTAVALGRKAFRLPFPVSAFAPPILATCVMSVVVIWMQMFWSEQSIARVFALLAIGGIVYLVVSIVLDAGRIRTKLGPKLLGKLSGTKVERS
jgi:O-antigen/teichoic acid export membrane protein